MGIESLWKIGIATRDLDESCRLFTQVLGLAPGPKGPFESLGQKIAICQLGDVSIELIEPVGPDAPIAKFIEQRGEGLQHIGFRVSDIEGLVSNLKKKGIEFVQEAPVEAEFEATKAKFIFARPRSFHGVLVEFVELL